MKLRWIVAILCLLMAGGSWFALLAQRKSLKREIVELENRKQGKGQRTEVRTIRLARVAGFSFSEEEKGILRRSYPRLPKIEMLAHLDGEDLKSLAGELIELQGTQKLEHGKESGLLYRPVMTLICRLEPEWFLEQAWKRMESGSDVRFEKMRTPHAFAAFLDLDRERALKWYEERFEQMEHHFFETFGLHHLTVAELLKIDPKRAFELTRRFGKLKTASHWSALNPGPFARLDNLSQGRRILSDLADEDPKQFSSEMRTFVAYETYRLGGKLALADMIESEPLIGVPQLIDYNRTDFHSPSGFNAFLELIKDASPEVRMDMVGYICASWAAHDRVTAEPFILNLPRGEIRQRALERLIRALAGIDSNRARDLLPEITGIEGRAILEQKISDREN